MLILAASVWHYILAILFAFVGILLMGVILLQRGRGVGLAGAFGGAGGNTTFGAKTGDFLTWVTVVGFALFILLSILMNYVFVPLRSELPTNRTIEPAPVEPGGAGALIDPLSPIEAVAKYA